MMLEALGANISGNLEEPNGSGFYTGAGDGPSCRSAQILYLNGQAVYLIATSTGLYATDSLQPTLHEALHPMLLRNGRKLALRQLVMW